MAYYGLSLSTSTLGVDDYIAALVSGAVEIPSYLFCWYIMERVGRRLSLAGFYLSGGVFILVTIFIREFCVHARAVSESLGYGLRLRTSLWQWLWSVPLEL